MSENNNLLNSKQVANFVNDGFLQFDELIPRDLCDAALVEMNSEIHNKWMRSGQPFNDVWKDCAVGEIFRLPAVQGAIRSLIGPNPRYDHHFPHRQNPGSVAQSWHQDSILDPRSGPFDIQLFFFPQDTPKEMGGTLILPGSHYRKVHESEIGRYKNIVGQQQFICKAGTIGITHMNIWHCAMPNFTDKTRYMFKVRLNPTVRQMLLWNTSDLGDPQVMSNLFRAQRWMGVEQRPEFVNRIKQWRYLTGNERFDHAYWLSRIENEPELIFCDQEPTAPGSGSMY